MKINKAPNAFNKTSNAFDKYENFDSNNEENDILCSEEYIQQKINVVFQPIIAQMIIEQPINPV